MTTTDTVERDSTLTIGGRRLSVRVRPGTGDGPPLVLMNGIGAAMDVLNPFVDALDPQIEVVRFDAPGVGASPTPAVPPRYCSIARLLGAALDRLGYGRVDALGISWGGGLAQQFAFQNPRRCRRLVLTATATGSVMVPGSPRVWAKMLTPRRHTDPDYARRIAGSIYGGSLRRESTAVPLIRDPVEALAGSSRLGYIYQLLSAAGWTSLPFLPLIGQRTLILAGADDPIVPLVNAKIMARLMRDVRLEVYEDGHLGLLVRAPELADSVARFLCEP